MENKSYMSKGEMLDRIIHCMGGRAAEELCLNDISTGAAGDIQQATEMARQMVMRYGMSEKLGPILFGTGREEVFLGRDFTAESKTYSEKVAATIDEEIKRIIDEQYERAKKILQEHLDQLHVIAKQLILHEKITGEQFRALLEGTDPAEVFPESETQKPEEKQDETPAEQAEERSEAAAEPVAEEKPEAEEPAAPEGTKTNEE